MLSRKRCCGTSEVLLPPYRYCRECFYFRLDELRPPGACSSERYNGKTDYKLIAHIERVEYMGFGAHNWLFNKALDGCKESLWKLEHSYDLYTEVRNKAIAEGFRVLEI